MITFPKAKVNIGLQVTEKRLDGFHNLETLFFPASICDILEIVEAPVESFKIYGAKLEGDPNENLCIKACNLLRNDFSIPPLEIHLYKKIPAGAGLGGGSSDAASTLILLNKLFALNLSSDILADYALRLGSDCPYFIFSGELDMNIPQGLYGIGRGESLVKMDIPALKGCFVKVSVPPVFVSTAFAYSIVTPRKPKISLNRLLELPLDEWKNSISNDFEENVFKEFPIIEQYKEQMYNDGAIYASMSGSGSAVFGIFRQIP